jgi:hypothetical protein
VALVDGAPDAALRRVDLESGRGRRGSVPAVRLVGGRAQPLRLRALRPAALDGRVRAAPRAVPRHAEHPLRASGAITSSSRCARRWVRRSAGHRARLAYVDLGRPPASRPDTAVQGNLDPSLVLAGVDVALRGTDRVLADNASDGRRHPRTRVQPRSRSSAAVGPRRPAGRGRPRPRAHRRDADAPCDPGAERRRAPSRRDADGVRAPRARARRSSRTTPTSVAGRPADRGAARAARRRYEAIAPPERTSCRRSRSAPRPARALQVALDASPRAYRVALG